MEKKKVLQMENQEHKHIPAKMIINKLEEDNKKLTEYSKRLQELINNLRQDYYEE